MTSGSLSVAAHLGWEERMIQSKSYVHEDSQGALRVGSLGISLDSVVIAFQQGHSAETIQQLYPALSLEEVYGAIAFYLANQDEVDQYLERQELLWDQVRQRARRIPARWCSDSARSARPPAWRHHEPATLPGEPASHLGRERGGGMVRPCRVSAALTGGVRAARRCRLGRPC